MSEQQPLKQVTIYTAAEYDVQSRAGAWSCILVFGEHKKSLNSFMEGTSLIRMALMAAISGLGALKMPCNVTIYSRCNELIDAYNTGLFQKWKKSFWKNDDGSQVSNADLWMVLSIQAIKHQIRFVRMPEIQQIYDEQNQVTEPVRCDQLVAEAIREFRRMNALDHQTEEKQSNNVSSEKSTSNKAGKE